jgi:predicted enzyme involved in methoxymalonyl-ACP biosynthesis
MALSCTVLGKQVEYAVLSALAMIATELHLATVIFKYCESRRNQEMLRFLQSVADVDSNKRYVVPVSLVEDRIRIAATKAGAWTVRLQHNSPSLVEAGA